ncbi:hypothetical protein DYB32_001747 [Aphanomyces invadans]|uniref:Uncharacterized protein n=1 Tax=Aphanomyces invadans TaxID=157072 RepID=A0A3R7D523_9STRA|nr:hypothetical protein DYB32_001747 [Aphanomyces invadans]
MNTRGVAAATDPATEYDDTTEDGLHDGVPLFAPDGGRISTVYQSPANVSPTKAIYIDRFYGDGSFLKLLQETLQKNAGMLKDGLVKLALTPVAIAYLNDRLHTTLCPKRATVQLFVTSPITLQFKDNSGRIDGWTIRGTTNSQSFRRVLSPRKSDAFNDPDVAPVGHLDVLKLSTLLTEITCIKVTGTPDQTVVHFNIFPRLKRIELLRTSMVVLDQLACFTMQLEVCSGRGLALHLPKTSCALDRT